MQTLLRQTKAYQRMVSDCANGTQTHATLVLFSDESYLRALLKECAKAFFGAKDGSRESELIESESYSDCVFLPQAGAKLTVDDGAYIIDESLMRPIEGGKKLFVLDGFHTASQLVQNKLLKVLEEPPQGVYFLIGATADFSVLPTVLSRVKKMEEPPFSEEAISLALSRKYPTASEVASAAAACGGVFSAAEQLLSGGGEEFRLAEEFLSAKNVEAFCRRVGERKQKTPFFAALRLLLRDILFYKTGQENYAALRGESVRALAKEYPVGAVLAAQEHVSDAEKQTKFNANFGQCLLSLAIAIAEEKARWQKLS